MELKIFNLPIVPDDLLKIERIISNAGWLFTSFNSLKEQQFELATYFHNDDMDFKVLLDRNFNSELINIFDSVIFDPKYILNKNQKIVAAHQAFFQLADIISEPSLSYYEYADTTVHNKVLSELNRFRIADNLPAKNWIDLALGRNTSILDKNLKPINETQFPEEEANKKLKHFEANFIILKKAVSLKKKEQSNEKVMIELMDWLHREYLFTGPSILFINYFLCPNKPGLNKMIKDYELRGLRNATWDLTFLQGYLEKLKNEIKQINNDRWLACSNDNAIKKIIPLMFANSDETLEDYQKRVKNSFIIAWGKNTGIGKKIYEQKCQYELESDSGDRKMNQDNFRRHVEKIQKNLDSELLARRLG
jgi:hypothetical protein